MRPRSSYVVEIRGPYVLIEDLDEGMSVTNDAENIIARLAAEGLLSGRRVIYRDTDGSWDELRHDGVRLLGFSSIGAARSPDNAIATLEGRTWPSALG